MDSKTLIKCAKCCARKSSAKRRLAKKRASYIQRTNLEKYAAAIKSVYESRRAGLDLLDQAIRDPNLADALQQQIK